MLILHCIVSNFESNLVSSGPSQVRCQLSVCLLCCCLLLQVGNYTIKLSMLNKDSKWTKALKLMLADLKVALQWMIQRDMAGQQKVAQSQMPSLAQEGPTHIPAV